MTSPKLLCNDVYNSSVQFELRHSNKLPGMILCEDAKAALSDIETELYPALDAPPLFSGCSKQPNYSYLTALSAVLLLAREAVQCCDLQ